MLSRRLCLLNRDKNVRSCFIRLAIDRPIRALAVYQLASLLDIAARCVVAKGFPAGRSVV